MQTQINPASNVAQDDLNDAVLVAVQRDANIILLVTALTLCVYAGIFLSIHANQLDVLPSVVAIFVPTIVVEISAWFFYRHQLHYVRKRDFHRWSTRQFLNFVLRAPVFQAFKRQLAVIDDADKKAKRTKRDVRFITLSESSTQTRAEIESYKISQIFSRDIDSIGPEASAPTALCITDTVSEQHSSATELNGDDSDASTPWDGSIPERKLQTSQRSRRPDEENKDAPSTWDEAFTPKNSVSVVPEHVDLIVHSEDMKMAQEVINNFGIRPQLEAGIAPIALDKDEKCYWLDQAMVCNPKQAPEVHVSKGLFDDLGVPAKAELEMLDEGSLILTSTRLILSSGIDAGDAKLSDVVVVGLWEDCGLVLSLNGRQHVYMLSYPLVYLTYIICACRMARVAIPAAPDVLREIESTTGLVLT